MKVFNLGYKHKKKCVYCTVYVCVHVFVGLATINSFYARETLKDSKMDIRPAMLEVRIYIYVATHRKIRHNVACMNTIIQKFLQR